VPALDVRARLFDDNGGPVQPDDLVFTNGTFMKENGDNLTLPARSWVATP
jgi:hypothetical protein